MMIKSLSEAVQLLKIFLDTVMQRLPFVDLIKDFIEKSINFSDLKLNDVLNDLIKALISFGLIDFAEYIFRVSNRSEEIKKNIVKALKRLVIYSTWLILFQFLSDLFIDRIVEKSDSTGLRIIIILCFFVISCAKFAYTTRESFALVISWVIVDKVVFTVLFSVIISLLSIWGYNTFSVSGFEGMILPVIIFTVLVGLIDFARNKLLVGIVSVVKR
ncbi:MAG: hypothetical protein ACI4GY_03410 [Acutalibacteraceae bacterium]